MSTIQQSVKTGSVAALAALLLSACTTTPITGLPPVPVLASGETMPVGTANQDAADDPAIWRNAQNPAASLIIGTDKKAGLYSYNLKGEVLNFIAAGELNNVSVHDGDHGLIALASDRTDPLNSKIAIFTVDKQNGALAKIGSVPSGPGEAYGLCLTPAPRIAMVGAPDALSVYAATKEGTVQQVMLTHKNGNIESRMGASWKIATQPEGCVIDPATGLLYVGEEVRGIWRIDPAQPDKAPEMFAEIDNQQMVADVEGLAIAPEGPHGGYLIASSQGDNAFAVYNLNDGTYRGRFRIVDGAIDGAVETDGIEVALGNFGPDYPQGLFVAQDGENDRVNGQATQNFKLVSWAAIKAALGL
jgi:3-phytase